MNGLSELALDPAFALAFRVREPVPARPTALLVLLHGVGGDETNLSQLASGIPADALVVLPRGRLELGTGAYGWFRVAFTAAGPRIAADEAEDSRRALIRFVEQLQAAHGTAPERTVVAGFSQGGIMSASVALSAPERVRGFAVLAGRILPELEPALASPDRLRGVQGLIAHARGDEKLPVHWAERAHAWLDQLGVPHALRLYPGGHGIGPAMARDFIDWLDTLVPAQFKNAASPTLQQENTR
jgi:phospholipase/carboxylesterase